MQGFIDRLKSRHGGHLVLLDAKIGLQSRARAGVVGVEGKRLLKSRDRCFRVVEVLLQNLAKGELQVGRGERIACGQRQLALDDLGQILPLFGRLIEPPEGA